MYTIMTILSCTLAITSGTEIRERIRSTTTTKDRVHLQQAHIDFQANVHTSTLSEHTAAPMYSEWDGTNTMNKNIVLENEDIFSHVRPLIEQQDRARALALKNPEATSLVETGAKVGKVHAFCEICILIMQMKERGQPHLCAGLNPDYFVSVRHSFVIFLLVCIYFFGTFSYIFVQYVVPVLNICFLLFSLTSICFFFCCSLSITVC